MDMENEVFQHCLLTVSENVANQDKQLYQQITRQGFKISNIIPLVVEKASTTQQDLIRLTDLLKSNICRPQRDDSDIIKLKNVEKQKHQSLYATKNNSAREPACHQHDHSVNTNYLKDCGPTKLGRSENGDDEDDDGDLHYNNKCEAFGSDNQSGQLRYAGAYVSGVSGSSEFSTMRADTGRNIGNELSNSDREMSAHIVDSYHHHPESALSLMVVNDSSQSVRKGACLEPFNNECSTLSNGYKEQMYSLHSVDQGRNKHGEEDTKSSGVKKSLTNAEEHSKRVQEMGDTRTYAFDEDGLIINHEMKRYFKRDEIAAGEKQEHFGIPSRKVLNQKEMVERLGNADMNEMQGSTSTVSQNGPSLMGEQMPGELPQNTADSKILSKFQSMSYGVSDLPHLQNTSKRAKKTQCHHHEEFEQGRGVREELVGEGENKMRKKEFDDKGLNESRKLEVKMGNTRHKEQNRDEDMTVEGSFRFDSALESQRKGWEMMRPAGKYFRGENMKNHFEGKQYARTDHEESAIETNRQSRYDPRRESKDENIRMIVNGQSQGTDPISGCQREKEKHLGKDRLIQDKDMETQRLHKYLSEKDGRGMHAEADKHDKDLGINRLSGSYTERQSEDSDTDLRSLEKDMESHRLNRLYPELLGNEPNEELIMHRLYRHSQDSEDQLRDIASDNQDDGMNTHELDRHFSGEDKTQRQRRNGHDELEKDLEIDWLFRHYSDEERKDLGTGTDSQDEDIKNNRLDTPYTENNMRTLGARSGKFDQDLGTHWLSGDSAEINNKAMTMKLDRFKRWHSEEESHPRDTGGLSESTEGLQGATGKDDMRIKRQDMGIHMQSENSEEESSQEEDLETDLCPISNNEGRSKKFPMGMDRQSVQSAEDSGPDADLGADSASEHDTEDTSEAENNVISTKRKSTSDHRKDAENGMRHSRLSPEPLLSSVEESCFDQREQESNASADRSHSHTKSAKSRQAFEGNHYKAQASVTRNKVLQFMTRAGGSKSENNAQERKKSSDSEDMSDQELGATGGNWRIHESSSDSDSDDDSDLSHDLETWEYELAVYYYEKHGYRGFLEEAEKRDTRYFFNVSKNTGGAKHFIKSLKKLRFQQIRCDNQDQAHLESIVRSVNMAGCTKAMVQGRNILLVGPGSETSSTTRRVLSMLENTEMSVTSSNRFQQANKYTATIGHADSVRASHGGARPKDKRPTNPPTDSDESDDDFRNYALRPRSNRKNSSDNSSDSCNDDRSQNIRRSGPPVYHGRDSRLKVKIYKADITTLNVECLVNAATRRLRLGGGVARAIASAAGTQLQDACREYISSGNTVGVTNLFVSPGGNLSARNVLHAVGPKWSAYSDQDKGRCIEDLRHTVLRCLLEAGHLGMTSIAFPSISAAIFKVPSELCAQSYMEAVKVFDSFNGSELRSPLTDVYFVDVDDIMVNTIQERFQLHWSDPCDPDMKQKDFDFCHQHLHSRQSLPNKAESPLQSFQPSLASAGQEYSSEGSQSLASPESSLSSAGKSGGKDYQIGEIQLHIANKPAMSFPSSLIITVGGVFDKLCKSSNAQMLENRRKRDTMCLKNVYEFFTLNESRKRRNRLLCTLGTDPHVPGALQEAFCSIDTAIVVPGIRDDSVISVTSVIITSSVLYAGTNSTGQEAEDEDADNISEVLVKKFAHLLLAYLNKASRESQLKQVFVAVSEDALPVIIEVMRSCGVSEGSTDPAQGGSAPSNECQICCKATTYMIQLSCCNGSLCPQCKTKCSSCPYCRGRFK